MSRDYLQLRIKKNIEIKWIWNSFILFRLRKVETVKVDEKIVFINRILTLKRRKSCGSRVCIFVINGLYYLRYIRKVKEFEMRKIIYINACVRRGVASRTNRLAQAYLDQCLKAQDCNLSVVNLEDAAIYPLTEKSLEERENAIENCDFSGSAFEFARSFAAADEVIIAAPYWDMSFPAALKLYIEQLCINKLTFCYDEMGRPHGLTNIKKAVYLTTSGGYIGNHNFGFDYIKAVFSTLFGIPEISFYSAEGLDILGNDAEQILAGAIEKMLAEQS